MDAGAQFPDSLGVNGIRAIRSELKSLNGRQVELIETVEGVGQQNGGILVNNYDKAKIYLGGGDPSLGEDFRRTVPPMIYANTQKSCIDVRCECTRFGEVVSGRHMQFSPSALLILIGFCVLVLLAVSSSGGTWFHLAEAVSTVVILAGVGGFLNGSRSRAR